MPRSPGSGTAGLTSHLWREPRAFAACRAPTSLLRERLSTFAEEFSKDARPGVIFEYGRLVYVNEAARRVLKSTLTSGPFLSALKLSIDRGKIDPHLELRTGSGTYSPVLHFSPNRKEHPTRICFLIKTREMTPVRECLSDREFEVVRLLVKGLTNQEIADALGISIETVRKHVSRALEKTGARTRAGLVGRALER
jgi:DNA-binding CsgD family transcriptional regulator